MANSWESLIGQWDAKLRKAFLDSIYKIRSEAQLSAIIAMIERGDIEAALTAVGIDQTSFRLLDRTFTDAFETGAAVTSASLPAARAASGMRVVIRFDVRNVRAERWLKEYSSKLIRDIVDDQRTMVREVLRAGMARGAGPRNVALDIVGRINAASGRREGGYIGLTDSQAKWVRGVEAELSDPAQYGRLLDRKLRDRRFDRTIRRAIADGTELPSAFRDTYVRTYRNRALKYRADSIARTEAMRALHESQDEAIRQAVEAGGLTSTQVSYVWRTAGDRRVRDSHASMDGQVRRFNEDFETGSGARLAYPGDPSGPPAETINCRCFREPTVNFYEGLR